MTERQDSVESFEQEILRLVQENNRLLQGIDDKLRKIVLNTSNIR